jgi:SecD/SecF fusion protein
VFIAGPVLTHWKERERVWTRRRRQVIDELGEVPAYATELHGAPIDIAPKERKRRSRRITTPDDPQQGVSREEFDEMVADISHETEAPPERERRRPRRATAVEEPQPAAPEPEADAGAADDSADALPEDVVMPDEPRRDRPKRPRNRRHGRPR